MGVAGRFESDEKGVWSGGRRIRDQKNEQLRKKKLVTEM